MQLFALAGSGTASRRTEAGRSRTRAGLAGFSSDRRNSPTKRSKQLVESDRFGHLSPNHDIVEIGGGSVERQTGNFLEAAPYSIANDGITEPARDRETEPRSRCLGRVPALALDHERWCRHPQSAAQPQVFGAALEGFQRCSITQDTPRGKSGRQTLATFGPAARQHLETALRLQALAKSMAPLANEAAGLIRALHGRNSEIKGPGASSAAAVRPREHRADGTLQHSVGLRRAL